MTKTFTLSLRCSPKVLNEQLRQQQVYIRLIAKLLKLLMSLESLSNLPKLLTPMSTLSTLAETRMDKGFHYVAHLSNIGEHLNIDQSAANADACISPEGKVLTFTPACGRHDREKYADVCADKGVPVLKNVQGSCWKLLIVRGTRGNIHSSFEFPPGAVQLLRACRDRGNGKPPQETAGFGQNVNYSRVIPGNDLRLAKPRRFVLAER